jgi:hypothetical protein
VNTLSRVAKISKAASAMAAAIDLGMSVYGLLTGTDGASRILSKLDSMQETLTRALRDIESAVDNNTSQANWRSWSTLLRDIQLSYQPIISSLATLTPEHRLVHDGMNTTLVEWCETGAGPGALTILSRQLSSLEHLFLTGGSVGVPSLLDAWEDFCDTALRHSPAEFAGQTRYTLTFSFMQQIFGMAGAIVVAHDGMLTLYLKDKPENPRCFAPLRPEVTRLFGDADTEGTVWNAFAQRLDAAIAPAPPVAQYGRCMVSPDNGPEAAAASSTEVLGNQRFGIEDQFYVSTGGLLAPGDTYFSGVRLRVDTAHGIRKRSISIRGQPGYPMHDYGTQPIIYLEVLPVRISAGLVISVGSWERNSKAQANFSVRDIQKLPFMEDRIEVVPAGSIARFNTAYAAPPAVTGPDRYPVITGVQLALRHGKRITLQLQYSTLDLSNPAAPSITGGAWAEPPQSATTYFAVGGADDWPVAINAVDHRAAGTTDHFPASNATFVASNPTVSRTRDADPGTCIGLAVQNAFPLHRLTWLQPAAVYGPGAADRALTP